MPESASCRIRFSLLSQPCGSLLSSEEADFIAPLTNRSVGAVEGSILTKTCRIRTLARISSTATNICRIKDHSRLLKTVVRLLGSSPTGRPSSLTKFSYLRSRYIFLLSKIKSTHVCDRSPENSPTSSIERESHEMPQFSPKVSVTFEGRSPTDSTSISHEREGESA